MKSTESTSFHPITKGEELTQKILAQPDVKRVVKLIQYDERFFYLIETPFDTFPLAVIGEIDADFTWCRHLARCSSVSAAERIWGDILTSAISERGKPLTA